MIKPESGYWYLCNILHADTDEILTQRVLWREENSKWYISRYQWHGNGYVYSQGDINVNVQPISKLIPEEKQ